METVIQESLTFQPSTEKLPVRLAELGLVLAVAFTGPLYRSVFAFFGSASEGRYSSNEAVLYAILSEIIALSVLAYILMRQGSSLRSLVGRWRLKDAAVAAGLFLYGLMAVAMAHIVIQKAAYSVLGHYVTPKDVQSMLGLRVTALTMVFVFINPLFEELIVRAYLMIEVIQITNSRALAVVASVGLQTAYHLYQGVLNASLISIFFLVMSLYFLRTRRIAPVILLHFGMDVAALFFAR